MALPDSCELSETHLLFWEVAADTQLAETDRLYEYCCTVACTNGLRPLGPVEVTRGEIPDLAGGEVLSWGKRYLSSDAAETYKQQGYLLCLLRLPVQPMGLA